MKTFNILVLILIFCQSVKAQEGVSINQNGSFADPSSILDVSSTDKGVLFPRMTKTERDNILNPATGLLIFQLDDNIGFYFYDGINWNQIGCQCNQTNNVELWASADDNIIEFYIDGSLVPNSQWPSSWIAPHANTIYYNPTVPYSTNLSSGQHSMAFKVRDGGVVRAFMAAIGINGIEVVSTGNGHFYTTMSTPGTNWYETTYDHQANGWTSDNTSCSYVHSNWDTGTQGFTNITSAYPNAKRIWEGNNCGSTSSPNLWVFVQFAIP